MAFLYAMQKGLSWDMQSLIELQQPTILRSK
jgi:hypothetical protein